MMRSTVIRMCTAGAILLSTCGQQADRNGAESETQPLKDASTRSIRVVTTTGMITDIVKNVGGERLEVTGLMGPGVDPHLYKASEGDVTRMSRADVIFYNGLHLEGKMAEVLEKIRSMVKTAAVTDGIERSVLLAPPEFEGAYDPHVWFDVSLWMDATRYVRDFLAEYDPDHGETYRNRAKTYLKELAGLHAYVKDRAAELNEERRVLITAHDAFNYFGRAYGFEVRGLQGISTASEAGTADVQSLAEFIVKRKIPSIFVETSVPARYLRALQEAVRSRGFEVMIGGSLYSDAMGSPGTPEGTYVGMIRHNIDTIVESLSM